MTEPKGLISSLDTSSFSLGDDEDYDDSIQDDYESAYFDIEKAASPNSKRRGQDNGVSSVKFETDMFNLAPANSEYDGSDEDYRDSSLLSSLSSISLPSKKTKKSSLSNMPRRPSNSKLPIRNVLDIFQELKLSFGRKAE